MQFIFFYLVFFVLEVIYSFLDSAMKRLSPKLVQVFEREMDQAKIPAGEWANYLKWLRYYLDFCAKYSHSPRDNDSLPEFLQKLASKNQTPQQQTQAVSSVNLFYELMKTWKAPPVRTVGPQADTEGWEGCQKKLKEEIRLRQYSDKTLKTYRQWITQFAEYTGYKRLEAVDRPYPKSHLFTEKECKDRKETVRNIRLQA